MKDRHPLERFEEELKAWSRQPPQTPPREAAYRLEARLSGRQRVIRRPAYWLVAAGVVAALGWTLFLPTTDEPVTRKPPEILRSAESAQSSLLLLTLEDGTPLYLTLPDPTSPIPAPPTSGTQTPATGDPS